jgi:hypothetical protein
MDRVVVDVAAVVKGNILLVVDDVPVIGDGTTKDHVGDTPTIPAKTITPM